MKAQGGWRRSSWLAAVRACGHSSPVSHTPFGGVIAGEPGLQVLGRCWMVRGWYVILADSDGSAVLQVLTGRSA